jgi:cytochrome c-type biogenesis protein CcmH
MKLLRHALLALALLSPACAFAVQPDEVLADPALEARARSLSKELRCLVCQNQSIDDSAAPLARDLRVLVRERLTGGDNDQQVLDFLVARYGEFVLLKPRFAWHNALLWLGPPGVLIGGGLLLLMTARRRSRAANAPAGAEVEALSAAEEARLAGLMQGGER